MRTTRTRDTKYANPNSRFVRPQQPYSGPYGYGYGGGLPGGYGGVVRMPMMGIIGGLTMGGWGCFSNHLRALCSLRCF
jgi:hypothetical protein